MRQYVKFGVLMPLLLSCAIAFAEDINVDEIEEFFNKSIELSNSFDVAVVDLYSDNAIIKTYRRYPFGMNREMAMTGAQWKELVIKTMPLAKMKNDRSTFSDIKITIIDKNKAKIKANRYSNLKCYTDTGYYVIAERQADGNYLIIEEYSETQPQSNC